MDAIEQGLRCRWAGCPEEFDDEREWIKHVSVHVFTLKPGERTPWLGPPEMDPDVQRDSTVGDDQSDSDDDDIDRGWAEILAMSSPARTPPQIGLPDSPDLAEKINGPSASAIATADPLRLTPSDALERALSHRTSASADDVEADLFPSSPSPSISASQNTSSNPSQETPLQPHLLSTNPLPGLTQTQFPWANPHRFRRGVFQISPAQVPVHSESGMNTSQSQAPLPPSQTPQSQSNNSQINGTGMSWLNTQAFRAPETQDSYESD